MSVAPFALLRVAALPLDRLTALAPVETAAQLDEVLTAREEMEALRRALEERLHALVPRLDGALRGSLLALRRRVHNARPANPPAALVEALVELDPETWQRIEAWSHAERRAYMGLAEAERTLAREVETHIRAGLERLASEEDLRRPLALASPDLSASLARRPARATGAFARRERSLLAYAMRAAAKTSPFSVFLHQAVIELVPTSPGGLPHLRSTERRSHAYINPGLAHALERALPDCCAVASRVTLRPNPTLCRAGGDAVEAVVSRPVVVSGRLWHSERRSRVRLHSAVVESLVVLPPSFTLAELIARLQRLGLGQVPATTLGRRLVDSGLVLVDTVVPEAPDPPTQFEHLRGCGCATAHALHAALTRIDAAAGELGEAPAARRLELLDDAMRAWRGARAAVPEAALPADLALVFEDGFFAGPARAAGGVLTGLLNEVARVLQAGLIVSPAYLALRTAFVRRFGRGGVCRDLPSFLQEMAELGPLDAASIRAEAERHHDVGPASRPPGAAPLTVLLQLVQEEGRTLAVVNEVHGGCGWLTARMALGPDAAHDGLRAHLLSWLARVAQAREPLDVTPCGDCNPLQAHPRLSARAVAWPGETPSSDGVLALEHLYLRHDMTTDALVPCDTHGTDFAPVYLGGTVPSRAWGVRYWLAVLAAPGLVEPPPERWRPPRGSVSEIEFRPRRTEGRVVLSRAAWWMRSERVRQRWLEPRLPGRLLAVAADRRTHGLPRLLFAKAAIQPERVDGRGTHKPVWIDTHNPLCLELLEPLLDHAEWIQFSEALPGPETSWAPFGDGLAHASELLVDMVLSMDAEEE